MTVVVSMLEGQTSVHDLNMDPSIYANHWRFRSLRDQCHSIRSSSSERQSLIQSSNATWIGSSTSAQDLYSINLNSSLCDKQSACLMIRFERMSCVILIPTNILHGIWLGVRYNDANEALSCSAHCQLVDKKLLLDEVNSVIIVHGCFPLHVKALKIQLIRIPLKIQLIRIP
jgi:hypothetical protein